MMIEGRYFERKHMKTKEVEDVLGGADSWKNVDRTQGMLPCKENELDTDLLSSQLRQQCL